jgi:hypothetical protein
LGEKNNPTELLSSFESQDHCHTKICPQIFSHSPQIPPRGTFLESSGDTDVCRDSVAVSLEDFFGEAVGVGIARNGPPSGDCCAAVAIFLV